MNNNNNNQNYGVFESKVIVNGQTIDNKDIIWKGNHNGLNVNLNDNGKRKTYHLDNKELLSLMKIPNINMPLEKRLEADLLTGMSLVNPIVLEDIHNSSNKRKTYNKKRLSTSSGKRRTRTNNKRRTTSRRSKK
jgi:hypothetical protein